MKLRSSYVCLSYEKMLKSFLQEKVKYKPSATQEMSSKTESVSSYVCELVLLKLHGKCNHHKKKVSCHICFLSWKRNKKSLTGGWKALAKVHLHHKSLEQLQNVMASSKAAISAATLLCHSVLFKYKHFTPNAPNKKNIFKPTNSRLLLHRQYISVPYECGLLDQPWRLQSCNGMRRTWYHREYLIPQGVWGDFCCLRAWLCLLHHDSAFMAASTVGS